ncbi:hypothetical protein OIU76_028994 [Salix suchowensis]|nr:hypothetical protein OIU76_028994 [Salix suchowensis]
MFSKFVAIRLIILFISLSPNYHQILNLSPDEINPELAPPFNVRVSNELGAGHPKASLFAVVVVSSCSLIISVVLAVLMLLSRHVISYAFTGGTEVAEAVAELSPFLAGTIVLGGVQPVLSGVAVGCGWQALVAYVNIACYYVIGIPLGCVLGFTCDMGTKVHTCLFGLIFIYKNNYKL